MSHSGIIDREGGSTAFARRIDEDPNKVKAWKRGDSIPAPYWAAVVDAGMATLEELAEGAARKLGATDPQAVAAE